uniref:Uncharacterized protein n=4 Tax=Torreya TaxID=50188 RepID=A0A650FIJ2_9CONI|nr:Ycf68 [Torreya grandis]ARR75340.1 Ycf68 [Torreya grandis]QGU93484.1 hypothetical protein Ycf68 [Torreya fargesii var. yunnanensis]QGU93567.1 hypothetical protein Ycf68 [Torreya californica]QGU93733.1 hypothetical protein Ycf68 [Torreya jackii]
MAYSFCLNQSLKLTLLSGG